MIAKKKILVQTMISLGLVSAMMPAMSNQFTNNGIYSDEAGQNQVQPNNNAIQITGNAYLRGKTYFYWPTLNVTGDLLKTTTHDTNNVAIHISDGLNSTAQFGVTATINGKVDIDEFTVGQNNTTYTNKATIGGNVKTQRFDVRSHGAAEVKGNLQSDTVNVTGALKVGGQLTAKNLKVYQNSSLTNGQGGVLEGAVIDQLHNGNNTDRGADLTLKNATINQSVVAYGGNLTLIGNLGKVDNAVDLTSHGGTVTVTNDAYLDQVEMFQTSHLKIDGKLQADHFGVYENSTLTNSNGGTVVGAQIGTLSNGTDARNGSNLTLNDVTITKKVSNYAGTLDLKGTFGAEGQGIDVVSSNGATTMGGNAYLRSAIISNNGTLKVTGTTYLSADSTENNGRNIYGDTTSSFESSQLIVNGNGSISGVKTTVDRLEINHNGQYNNNDDKNQFIVSGDAKLNAKQIVINGNVSFFSQSANSTIHADYLELNTTEKNRFQCFTAMDFDKVVVNTTGRIEGYTNTATLHAKEVTVAKNGHLTVTSKVNNVSGTIDTLVLDEGATLDNGITKNNLPERGYTTQVTNLTGVNATITNVDGSLTLGDNAGTVDFNGTILDNNDATKLVLNQNSQWTVANDSRVNTINMAGGTTDLSTTEANVAVKALTGDSGTVVVDAAKTNKLTVENTANETKLDIRASENADKVTTSQAEAMMNRVEGVTNKTGHVDEGMYQGAIAVDSQGNATQAKNGLMSDTLEVASASTLSLNRILMNDVRKRLGDVRTATDAHGVWARYDGGRLSGEG